MIEINLLPDEYRKKEAAKITMPEIPVKKTALSVLGGVLALQIVFSVFAIYQKIEFSGVEKELKTLSAEMTETTRQKKEIEAMKTRLNKINALVERKFFWSSLLDSLSNSMTKGVWLVSLEVADEKKKDSDNLARVFRVSGSAIGQGDETAYVGKFIKQLKSHPLFAELFSDIQLSRIDQKKIRDFDVYDFSLSCPFNPEKSGGAA